jgi:RNA polymerase sigma-70 factor (ECF subfamily)
MIAARLIRRYQDGDLAAFIALHDRYRPRVLRTARARLRCKEDAEDVTQLVFFKVLETLGSYRPAGRSFRRWLLTVTKNAAEDHRRRACHTEATAPEALDRWLDDLQDALPAWGEDAAVHGLVAELSAAERQVLVLLYRLELSPRETSIALGRSEASVYKLHSRTLAKLRAQLRAA